MPSDGNASRSFELNFIKSLKNSNKSHRYLVCHKCYGYYPLKDNELPEDFVECECGNDLEFYENIDDLSKIKGPKNNTDENNSEMFYDDYEELQEIVDVLKSKSEKRKEFFEELSTRIEMQEEILNDVKYGEWKLWDAIEEKSLQNNIKGQKSVVETVIEQEDNFLSYIQQKRSKEGHAKSRSKLYYIIRIIVILAVISIIILEVFFLLS